MTARGIIRPAVLAFAALAFGVACDAAAAQTKPPVPTQSTRLSAPESKGSLVVDLDNPPATAPAEAPPDETAPPAAVDHLEPGHTCRTGDLVADAAVREAGLVYGIDPCLVVAVMGAESGYRRYAVSPKGACGYMQLMPETARRFGVADIFDPRQNIHAGTRYLRFLLDRFGGSLELALAGYNAGEGAVERYGMKIPPYLETQNYVRIITRRYFTRHAGQSALRQGSAPAAPAPVAQAPGSPRPTSAWRISVSFDEQN